MLHVKSIKTDIKKHISMYITKSTTAWCFVENPKEKERIHNILLLHTK